MTSPYAAEPDNDRLRAGIVDGSIDPAGVNVRALLAEVVAERDALRGVVASARAAVVGRHPLPYCGRDGRIVVDLLTQLKTLLPDTHDHADAAGAGGGIA